MNSENISVVLMSDQKSYAALGAIEIASIPHISIINMSGDVLAQYKKQLKSLLTEVHLKYKANNLSSDISLELLWKTSQVLGQQYKARIQIFLIVRVIDYNRDNACNVTYSILEFCKTSLNYLKYKVTEASGKNITKVVSQINDSRIMALVKEERLSPLNNQMLPYCLSYDRFPTSDSDLSTIVNTLTAYPDCAISFQVIPTVLNNDETIALDHYSQSLDNLSNGVLVPGSGNITITLAKKHAETYKYYSERKNTPLFFFNILIYGTESAVSSISSQIYGQFSSESDKTADFKLIDIPNTLVKKDSNFFPLPWAINGICMEQYRNLQVWNVQIPAISTMFRLPYIITDEEAVEFFRLPIGGGNINAGLEINESSYGEKTYKSNIINSGDITIGRLASTSKTDTIGIKLPDLAKHMLVLGTPGSGKTTFSVGMLDTLWKHGIPFLVIEPAKNEYRALVQTIPDLQVFTPGKNFISPFVFNPFIPPKNVRLETYKSTLKTAFAAAVSMTTPLDKIFEESINNCYSDFRWLDTYTSESGGKVFNISDFIRCFKQTFLEIGYVGDSRNIGKAGVVRLKSLERLFDNYSSIPVEDLLRKPTVIELSAIENNDEKALIISMLLLSIMSYVNSNYLGQGGLKNVILLEEAHVLLDPESNSENGDAKPSAIAQNLVKRMLSEMRSYGVGMIIADQSPRKVSIDVVAMTDIKTVFRLVEGTDKQIIGDSMGMSDSQIQRLAKLRPGEAFFFFNKLDTPEEIVTPDYRQQNNIDISITDEELSRRSTYWRSHQEMLRPYPECSIVRYCPQTCDYQRRVLAKDIARRIFVKYIKADTDDFSRLEYVLGHISALIKNELNFEPFTQELLSCVKVHLWRRIKYETNIPIKEIQMINSLKK